MNVAILGGGFTGLTAAYYIRKKGHEVTLFEKENVLGGLAVGFKNKNWNWYLERAYHHLFANDLDIIRFSEETGFNGIFFEEPETASLFHTGGINYRIFPLDSPQDLVTFPLLSFPERMRTGLVLAFLKISPPLFLYEKQTAKEFLVKTMGKKVWNVLWEPLFRKKFGKYAENILASFMWARITKRTKKLGYVKGGFQTLIDHVEKTNLTNGVTINKGYAVTAISKKNNMFEIEYLKIATQEHLKQAFDAVISTLPSPVVVRAGENVLPGSYLSRFKKLEYLHALSVIFETEKPLLDKTYWLNMCDDRFPFVGVMQHTNFIDKIQYNDHHILYVANYLTGDDKLLKMGDREINSYYAPYLKKINPEYEPQKSSVYVFKAPFAQPVFNKEFVANKPDFITPTKNFFIANLDMTYPYDRGTNYAVKLGKDVASFL